MTCILNFSQKLSKVYHSIDELKAITPYNIVIKDDEINLEKYSRFVSYRFEIDFILS
ncbi:hypothetical protein M595_3870 [Lyngbya aestuarii BL J]|uniref:Uncharacterized protein n=1 Tax=Lyngbya aestuarii BL J TaxID=1348334 RepID=U7QIC9_9CYAN|nr:hypothetical protein M595_3870 [Lyngbya aestuarii BL J]